MDTHRHPSGSVPPTTVSRRGRCYHHSIQSYPSSLRALALADRPESISVKRKLVSNIEERGRQREEFKIPKVLEREDWGGAVPSRGVVVRIGGRGKVKLDVFLVREKLDVCMSHA